MKARSTVALVAVAAAACGGGTSKEDYEEQVNAIFRKAETEQLQSEGRSLRAQAASFQESARRLERVAAELAGVVAPSEVTVAHNDLIAGISSVAKRTGDVARAARSGQTDRLGQLVDALVSPETSQRLREASSEFQRKGYKLDFMSQLPR